MFLVPALAAGDYTLEASARASGLSVSTER
jgi:hypothetical protein